MRFGARKKILTIAKMERRSGRKYSKFNGTIDNAMDRPKKLHAFMENCVISDFASIRIK